MRRTLIDDKPKPNPSRIVWEFICLIFVSVMFYQTREVRHLTEQNKLLRSLDSHRTDYCSAVQRVNTVCEMTLVELAQRLGLDRKLQPLVSTAIWRRGTHSLSIEEARTRVCAEDIEGETLSDVIMGGN